mgnify:CR=1 FL=1
MRNIPLGVYLPGRTLIHRAPAGGKFLALLAFILAHNQMLHTAHAIMLRPSPNPARQAPIDRTTEPMT